MVWWALLGKIAAGAAKVGKVAGTVGKAAATVGKTAAVAGAKVGRATLVAGKAAGKTGKAVGSFAKGAYIGAAPKAMGGGKLAAGAGKAAKAGHMTGKVMKTMQSMGGGGGGGAAVASEAEKTQHTPGTPLGPPTGWSTSEPQRPIILKDPAEETGRRERGRKYIDNPKKVVSGKTVEGYFTRDEMKLQQGAVSDMLRKTAEREHKAGNIEPPPRDVDLTGPGVGEQTTGGERGVIQPPTPYQQTGIPESRDVREPFHSKALRGTARILTAGAPGPIRDMAGSIGNKWAVKQGKIEEQRDLIWKMADTIDSPEEIKKFTKNQNFVEAFTNRLPGVNDKEDVEEFLSMSLEGIKPTEFLSHGWKAGLEAPAGDEKALKLNVGGQEVYLSPEEAGSKIWEIVGMAQPPEVTGTNDPNMIFNMTVQEAKDLGFDIDTLISDKIIQSDETLVRPGGEAKAGMIKERGDYLIQFKKDNPKASKTEGFLSYMATQGQGRFTQTAVSGGLVMLDKFTGEQNKVVLDKSILTKWGVQPMYEVDAFGNKVPNGFVLYNRETPAGEEPEVIPFYPGDAQYEEDLLEDKDEEIETIKKDRGNDWWWVPLLPEVVQEVLGYTSPTKKKDTTKKKKATPTKRKKQTKIEKMGLTPPGTEKSERVLEYLGGHGEI